MTYNLVTFRATDAKVTACNYWRTLAFLFRRSIAWPHRPPRRRDCQHFISETPPTAAFGLGVAYLASAYSNLHPYRTGGHQGFEREDSFQRRTLLGLMRRAKYLRNTNVTKQ